MSTISDALPFGLREDAEVLAALRGDGGTAADAVPGTRASWAGGFRRHATDSSDGPSRAGLDALFDRYHPWLYGLFMRTLRDHDNATLALGQTLGNVAAARLTRPEQLRLAVARAAYENGMRVGEGRSRVTRIRRGPDATTQLLVGFMDAGGDGELRRLVWRAMETLAYRERLLFELEWHDRLDGRELLTVIGGRNAQTVLNRARDRIRATLTTAVAVWYGSERCGDLRRLVRHAGAAEGRPGVMRGIIEQHLYGTRTEPPCKTCLDNQDTYALSVLGSALPVFGTPPFLREQAIEIAQEYRSGLRTAPVEHVGFTPGMPVAERPTVVVHAPPPPVPVPVPVPVRSEFSGSPWGAPEVLPPSSTYLSPAPPQAPANVVAFRRRRVVAGAVAAAAAVLFSFSAVMIAQNQIGDRPSDVLAAATPDSGDQVEQGPSPIGDPPDSKTGGNAPEPDNFQIDTNTRREHPVPIPEPRTTDGTAGGGPVTPTPTPTKPSPTPTKPTPTPTKPSPTPTPTKPTPTPSEDDDDPTTPPPDDDPTGTPAPTPTKPAPTKSTPSAPRTSTAPSTVIDA